MSLDAEKQQPVNVHEVDTYDATAVAIIAQQAKEREESMTLGQAFSAYKKAVFWSIMVSMVSHQRHTNLHKVTKRLRTLSWSRTVPSSSTHSTRIHPLRRRWEMRSPRVNTVFHPSGRPVFVSLASVMFKVLVLTSALAATCSITVGIWVRGRHTEATIFLTSCSSTASSLTALVVSLFPSSRAKQSSLTRQTRRL